MRPLYWAWRRCMLFVKKTVAMFEQAFSDATVYRFVQIVGRVDGTGA